MDRRILNKKGISILEVAVAMMIIGVIVSTVIPSYVRRVNQAKYEKTVNELTAIAQASLDYYNSQDGWPGTPTDLAPTYMNAAVIYSPFGGPYKIKGQTVGQSNTVTVSTTVPPGLAQNYNQGALFEIPPGSPNTIEITQQLPNEFSGRLEYEKKYQYLQ